MHSISCTDLENTSFSTWHINIFKGSKYPILFVDHQARLNNFRYPIFLVECLLISDYRVVRFFICIDLMFLISFSVSYVEYFVHVNQCFNVSTFIYLVYNPNIISSFHLKFWQFLLQYDYFVHWFWYLNIVFFRDSSEEEACEKKKVLFQRCSGEIRIHNKGNIREYLIGLRSLRNLIYYLVQNA